MPDPPFLSIANTPKSVITRSTTPAPVSGRLHRFNSFGSSDPSLALAVCSITTQRRRAPSRGGHYRPTALDRRAQRDGRDRADAAGPPPAPHRREGQDGLAEGVRIHETGPRRGHHRPVQARDRGRAALAYGRAS